MRKLRALAFTAVLGFGLAACSQGGSGAISAIDVDPKSVEAHVTKLAGEAFKGTATTAADIESLRAALPADVAVSWGGLSFDAATGSITLNESRDAVKAAVILQVKDGAFRYLETVAP
jgi:hypothetical protein